jgi:hypothetical protein
MLAASPFFLHTIAISGSALHRLSFAKVLKNDSQIGHRFFLLSATFCVSEMLKGTYDCFLAHEPVVLLRQVLLGLNKGF